MAFTDLHSSHDSLGRESETNLILVESRGGQLASAEISDRDCHLQLLLAEIEEIWRMWRQASGSNVDFSFRRSRRQFQIALGEFEPGNVGSQECRRADRNIDVQSGM